MSLIDTTSEAPAPTVASNVITPTKHQQEAITAVLDALDRGDRHVGLEGYAGTGKTTIAMLLMQGGAELLAPTGKAAARLRDKTGCHVHTIHARVCGAPAEEQVVAKRDVLTFEVNKKLPALDNLVLVDEGSMVDRGLGKMLEKKMRGDTQILWIQDPFQLPPVSGEPFIDFAPAGMLTEVLRQQGDSPVLDYATEIRSHNRHGFDRWQDGGLQDAFCMVRRGSHLMAARALLRAREEGITATVLTHTNKARNIINVTCRNEQGIAGPPRVGEPLVCLVNHETGPRNGEVFTVASIEPHPDIPAIQEVSFAELDTKQPFYIVPRHMGLMHQERQVSMMKDWYNFWQGTPYRRPPGHAMIVDYGYALTTHKSQGSSWEVVIHYAERWAGDEPERLHYTAVTRAERGYLQIQPT